MLSRGRPSVRQRMQSSEQAVADDAAVVVGFVPAGEFAGVKVGVAMTVPFGSATETDDAAGLSCRRCSRSRSWRLHVSRVAGNPAQDALLTNHSHGSATTIGDLLRVLRNSKRTSPHGSTI